MSRTYAEVIGDPIAQSKSPVIHNFWLGQLGIEADYRACHVRPDELPDYFAARRTDPVWRGCNITIPHKQAIMALADRIEPAAQIVGAANTVFRVPDGALAATNTDVDGVGEALAGIDFAQTTAVVLGAGGAARAAFAFLARSQCREVRVVARDESKAQATARECGLGARIHAFANPADAFENAGLLINATQLGMSEQAPMPDAILAGLAAMRPGGRVFDMVYAPLETGLLREAKALGLDATDGLTMLIGQAATAFERFFGQPAPREHNDALRKKLLA